MWIIDLWFSSLCGLGSNYTFFLFPHPFFSPMLTLTCVSLSFCASCECHWNIDCAQKGGENKQTFVIVNVKTRAFELFFNCSIYRLTRGLTKFIVWKCTKQMIILLRPEFYHMIKKPVILWLGNVDLTLSRIVIGQL